MPARSTRCCSSLACGCRDRSCQASSLVPGALVYCLGEGLVIQTNVINGTGLAFMSMDLSIKQPAYVGDTIHVVVEVTQARPASTGQLGVVTTGTASATSAVRTC